MAWHAGGLLGLIVVATCLRALGQGCQTLRHQPVLRWKSWEGLLASLSLFDEVARDLPAEAVAPFQSTLVKMRRQIAAAHDDAGTWVPLLNQLIGERWSELNHWR